MKISNLARSAQVDTITAMIDVGGAGSLCIFTGTQPANTTDPDSGTLLATCPMSNPAFGAASAGVATANPITSDTNIDATGTAGYFRMKSGAGTVIFQGTVGTSGADINFNSVGFIAGGTCAISSLTYTKPA